MLSILSGRHHNTASHRHSIQKHSIINTTTISVDHLDKELQEQGKEEISGNDLSSLYTRMNR